MTAFEFLLDLHSVCSFQTREGRKTGKASNGELRRWFLNKAVMINGERPAWNDTIAFPVENMVLFPKHPITLA